MNISNIGINFRCILIGSDVKVLMHNALEPPVYVSQNAGIKTATKFAMSWKSGD